MIVWLYLLGHKYLFQRQVERHFLRAYGHLFANPLPALDCRDAHRQAMLALVAKSVAEGLAVFRAASGWAQHLATAGGVLFAVALIGKTGVIPAAGPALPYLSWSALALFMISLLLSVCQLHTYYTRYMEQRTLHWCVTTYLFPLQAHVLLICTLGSSLSLLPGMSHQIAPLISIILVAFGLQWFGAASLLGGLKEHSLQEDELQAYLQATADGYPADALANLLMMELEGVTVTPQVLMVMQRHEPQQFTV
jgi:hypothetical protein